MSRYRAWNAASWTDAGVVGDPHAGRAEVAAPTPPASPRTPAGARGRAATFSRATVEEFTAALLDDGAEAATALSRQRGVRRFTRWLADEGIARDELAGMRPPKLDDKIPAEVTTGQLRALLATCRERLSMTSATRRSSG